MLGGTKSYFGLLRLGLMTGRNRPKGEVRQPPGPIRIYESFGFCCPDLAHLIYWALENIGTGRAKEFKPIMAQAQRRMGVPLRFGPDRSIS